MLVRIHHCFLVPVASAAPASSEPARVGSPDAPAGLKKGFQASGFCRAVKELNFQFIRIRKARRGLQRLPGTLQGKKAARDFPLKAFS